MNIIGNIIKGVIDITEKLTPESSPLENQKEVLKNLLEKAKGTAFGKFYNFEEILKSDAIQKRFSEAIPYFDYNKINEVWWHKLHEGHTNITWPDNPDYYALSSGTTGKTSKRIPVTQDMIESIKSAGIAQIIALSHFDLPPSFFDKGILMLGSSTDLIEKEDHLEGEISGISAHNIPSWFRGYYKPGEKIAKIDDWDERVKKIAKKAKEWDIGAISGIPSWIELMLNEVIAYNKIKNIHEIWPNLEVYTSGGVAFGPYEKSFNALLERPITIIDTYLASEGFIAFQARPETDAMQLVTDGGIYFEFVPFHPDYINQDGSLASHAPALTLDDVELNKDYVLIISTVSGTWRYIIGDTIEFTDIERAEIKITGRTKFFLNTVGSQLSVNKLDDAVKHLEERFNIKIKEYTICAKRYDGEFYHSWYLATEDDVESEKLAESMDDFLKEANKNYRVARTKALKGVKVKTIPASVFHDWNAANKKKGGQVKMERVMNEDKFSEWEAFVEKN
ncbi:GH3 auxin-responsive promoter family protein [Mariniflexile litorale]|uniref:GH3 auxin-responsive promoter family protein n=1 Tax=Mariniflexile litorale TaxID=3045158 RepID=A0AAU7EHJ0_9FLAO|nr:GH3 auxin-responsive promoter family protein [Mariniflexile sp. KMM 9835]MDQ8211911.1 GH3 auxin-responsive promoter family protein [Mariniflexile sp. KMM 9835]